MNMKIYNLTATSDLYKTTYAIRATSFILLTVSKHQLNYFPNEEFPH